jgi:competence CoiA-like predicted nuclease
VLLHEETGNYKVTISSALLLNTVDVIDFFCPVCHSILNTKKGEKNARFIHIDETGE